MRVPVNLAESSEEEGGSSISGVKVEEFSLDKQNNSKMKKSKDSQFMNGEKSVKRIKRSNTMRNVATTSESDCSSAPKDDTKGFVGTREEDNNMKLKRLKKLVAKRTVSISLKRIPINSILICSQDNNSVEVTYTAIDETDPTGKKYLEYRVDTFNAIPKRKTGGRSKSLTVKNTVAEFHLPRASNFVFNVIGYKEDIQSILDTIKGQKMSTMVLDAFLSLRLMDITGKIKSEVKVEQPIKVETPPHKFKYLSVHFLPVYDKEQPLSTYTPNMTFFPSFSLENCVLIAPQYICKHFYLAVINFPCKTVYIYDSSWKYVSMMTRFHQVRCILKALTGATINVNNPQCSWEVYFVEKCAQQTDEYNCGCFVIYFTENELKGKAYKNEMRLTKSDITQIRTSITRELLHTTQVGKGILEAISA